MPDWVPGAIGRRMPGNEHGRGSLFAKMTPWLLHIYRPIRSKRSLWNRTAFRSPTSNRCAGGSGPRRSRTASSPGSLSSGSRATAPASRPIARRWRSTGPTCPYRLCSTSVTPSTAPTRSRCATTVAYSKPYDPRRLRSPGQRSCACSVLCMHSLRRPACPTRGTLSDRLRRRPGADGLSLRWSTTRADELTAGGTRCPTTGRSIGCFGPARPGSELAEACPERRDVLHGDLLHGNVLISEDANRIAAVFSWKCSQRGDFLFDTAWCTFWGAFFPGIAAAEMCDRVLTAPWASQEPTALAGAPHRHHCYELQIGATHLAWNAWVGDEAGLRWVAAHTAMLLERGPLAAGGTC